MMAFACLAIARRNRATAALVADDQVFLDRRDGRIFASCPPAIAGMIELRGSGIVRIDHVTSAPLDLAVTVVAPGEMERLPPDGEVLDLDDIGRLPMVRIVSTVADPLAVIGALLPSWRAESPFW
jgi:serine kinase of HPr protein (carbohydrate metabolism regulator)